MDDARADRGISFARVIDFQRLVLVDRVADDIGGSVRLLWLRCRMGPFSGPVCAESPGERAWWQEIIGALAR